MFIKKLILFMLLFVLSCTNTVTTPSDNGGGDANLSFLERVAGTFLVDDDGHYLDSYSEDGKTYDYKGGGIYTFKKDPTKTKGIYSKRYRDEYYGHEIRSGVLYVTDIPATDMDSIKWEDAKKVGTLVSDYSGEFLSSVKGKKLSGCANYFSPNTGRRYLEKFTNIDENFTFVQALSTTKSIYENEKDGVSKFIGLSIVGKKLYTTVHSSDIKNINWKNPTDLGELLDN